MTLFNQYIKKLRMSGKQHFTTNEAMIALNKPKSAVLNAVSRAKKTRDIISPFSGLYVIVPPEHQHAGSIPDRELIPIVMGHLNRDYYACLLSAAEIHGASHQKPQIFQVMTNKRMHDIRCGYIVIKFIYKKSLDTALTQNIVVNTGYLKVSTPEYTALDLMQYTNNAGGINHVATVLSELIESIDIDKLVSLAYKHTAKSWVQRLGYILDSIDPMDTYKQQDIIAALQKYLSAIKITYVPLTPDMPSKGCVYNKKWKIIENTTIESDI